MGTRPPIVDNHSSHNDKLLDNSFRRCYNPTNMTNARMRKKRFHTGLRELADGASQGMVGAYTGLGAALRNGAVASSKQDGGRPLQRNAVVGLR